MHEMKFFNGILETPDEAIEPPRRHRRPAQPHQLPVGLGAVRQHAVQVVQAEHPRGRRPRADDRPLAGPGSPRPAGLDAPPVRERVRHRPDHLRPARHRAARPCSAASSSSPCTGHSFASVLADRRRTGDEHVAVLRDGRQPGDRRRTVEGGVQARPGRRLRHRAVGAVRPRPTTSRSATTSPPPSPTRLAELIDQWWQRAEIHGVLPLDDRMIELFGARFRDRSPHPADRRYVYRPPMSPIPAQASAAIGGRSFDLTARVTRAAGQEGVLWATGTENSGISVFVQDDRLVVDYNAFDDHTILSSDVEVPVGDSMLTARFRRGEQEGGSVADRDRRRRCGTRRAAAVHAA